MGDIASTWGHSISSSAAFRPDYGRNWRQFLGAGYFGDRKPEEMEWDPDDASVFTVHRDRFLQGKNWNFTTYSDGGFMPENASTEGSPSEYSGSTISKLVNYLNPHELLNIHFEHFSLCVTHLLLFKYISYLV